MRRKIVSALLFFSLLSLFTISCYLVFQPWLNGIICRRSAQKAAASFLEKYHKEESSDNADVTAEPNEPTGGNATENIVSPEEAPPKEPSSEEVNYAELLEAMTSYNLRIYEEKQRGLCDPWSYTVPAIDLSAYGLDAEATIAVLQIPAIDVTLPIYSGASADNLSKGAALLSQTSFPIGGENTNTVIGAHRGWNGEDYLRNIEEVQLGDEVIILNFWQELEYSVVEIKIIEPNDISQIQIQPNRELLTIFTCHPYASGGKYRYLLICERAKIEATRLARSLNK